MENGFSEEDEYLEHLLDAAEEAVLQATHRTLEECKAAGGGTFPKTLQHAVLLLAGHWYAQRESVSTVQMHEVPDALQSLLKPWRKLVEEEEDEGGADA